MWVIFLHIAVNDTIVRVCFSHSLKEIIKNPETYKGKVILLSGVILGSKNTKGRNPDRDASKPADMEGLRPLMNLMAIFLTFNIIKGK